MNLSEHFGDIDIYLFDQLLKGRFDDCETILDAGCGSGRNLHYFLKNNFEVYGVDQDTEAIEAIQDFTTFLKRPDQLSHFHAAAIEQMPFEDEMFDVVICTAVLHFASGHQQFDTMLRSCWRALKRGGYFFARLTSNIGIESLVTPLGNGRHLLPDGSERYLVDMQQLLDYTALLNGELFEPIKTTNVQNMRSMTTWCLQKK